MLGVNDMLLQRICVRLSGMSLVLPAQQIQHLTIKHNSSGNNRQLRDLMSELDAKVWPEHIRALCVACY